MILATREEILAQIEAVLGSISGVGSCVRNRGLVAEDQKPAIIMLDGREDIVSKIVEQKSVRMPPAIFRMQPQIFVILQQRDTANVTIVDTGANSPVGPDLNRWRDLILAALINDPALVEMLTTTGQIVYRGMETDLQTGATLLGEARLFIDFHYVWQPPP